MLGGRQWRVTDRRRCIGRGAVVAVVPDPDHCRRTPRTDASAARATMGTWQFGIIVVVILASAACALWRPEGSLCVFAGGLLALAAWLARHDVGRHTVRQTGLVRFIAVCLLSGYGRPSARCWVSAAPWRPGMHGGTLRCARSHWASCSRCSSATRLSSSRPSWRARLAYHQASMCPSQRCTSHSWCEWPVA